MPHRKACKGARLFRPAPVSVQDRPLPGCHLTGPIALRHSLSTALPKYSDLNCKFHINIE